MYSNRAGIVFGFHGCDESVCEELVNGKAELKLSENGYDWLGKGMYFWENSYSRALEWAEHLKKQNKQNKIEKPAVVGAVINLGHCLDLLDYDNLKLLKNAYSFLKETTLASGLLMKENKNVKGNADFLIRELDYDVIEMVHHLRYKESNKSAFDSVRGVFWEGKELYTNAGFKEKNHIQLCIRNPNCIKGYFIPREHNKKYQRM